MYFVMAVKNAVVDTKSKISKMGHGVNVVFLPPLAFISRASLRIYTKDLIREVLEFVI